MRTSHRLIRPAHLNQFGFLFGGQMLAWVDEISWISASLEYPQCRFVTIGMNLVEFRHAVHEGAIVRFECRLKRQGRTSVTYEVFVFTNQDHLQEAIFSTEVSFVNVDQDGHKAPIINDK